MIALLALWGCGSEQGAFVALTYNVAGLPQGISSSDPETNIPQISPKLNAYDLVLVQEDFAYHDELAAEVTLPYASIPATPTEAAVADGLNRWSNLPFDPVVRTRWETCFGGLFDGASDCLAEKGFSMARTELGTRTEVTVVNLHMEAGGGPEDQAARASNVTQLLAALAQVEGALIVAGDTNLQIETRPEDGVLLQDLLDGAGLTDSCDALGCPEQHIDRVLLRSSDAVTLTPTAWAVAQEFVTAEGADLSDHPAIRVDLEWTGSAR